MNRGIGMAMATRIAGQAARTVHLTNRILRYSSSASDRSASLASPLLFRRHASAKAADHGKLAGTLIQGTLEYQVRFSARGLDILPIQGGTFSCLPSIWLRDNCRCALCINQETMQRKFNIFDAPPTTMIDAKAETDGLRVTWDHENHKSFYEWAFIRRYIENKTYNERPSPDLRNRRFWGSEIAGTLPTMGYEEAMDSTSDTGVAKMTNLIMQHGFVFVDNTPFDDAIHTKRLLERIGPIRETHYGGFYDFVPDMAKADTAYTNIALPAHTDTTYFADPAGLQAFHMLSHTAPPGAPEGVQPTGGESLLVDGFRAANILMTEDLASYKLLHKYRVPWHASGNQGVTITPDKVFPIIELSRKGAKDAEILRIRWNNDDRGVVPTVKSRQQLRDWYAAVAKWNEILRRSSSEFWFQLKPGRTLIFDNYRVLHGRSAFTGWRRMCGAYINRDDFLSRWRNTNLSREEILAQVIG